MIKNIISFLANQSCVIAYSGGLDSTVLLHQLIQIQNSTYNIKIRAIHVNHNLTSLSEQWTEHCKINCRKHQIKLSVKNININQNLRHSEEELRIHRYNIIYNHLSPKEILLTGHHMNDQCETFFLSLKRGSGPTGLSSMAYVTKFGKTKIIRPLLNKTKQELEIWANSQNLNWIEDFSNLNINYDRNYIRHEIIPKFEKKWPFFLKNCFRSTQICQEETSLLNDFLLDQIQNCMRSDYALSISYLENIKKEKCTAIIRRWIQLHTIRTPSYKSIQSIYDQIVLSRIDANPKIVLGKNEVRRYKKYLYFITTPVGLNNTIIFWHNLNMKLMLPHNLGYLQKNHHGMHLPRPKKNALINIRFQFEGKILISSRHRRRKIKKIWQEYNIPPWLRNQIPLLFYNNTFISALGIFSVNVKQKNMKKWNVAWHNDIKLYNDTFLFS